MRPQYYILGPDHQSIPVDLETWARWFEVPAARVVKQERVGRYLVSTVFLGLDHNFFEVGPPILFETMVFNEGESLNEQERCATWEEALQMHEAMVQKVRQLPEAQGGTQ